MNIKIVIDNNESESESEYHAHIFYTYNTVEHITAETLTMLMDVISYKILHNQKVYDDIRKIIKELKVK